MSTPFPLVVHRAMQRAARAHQNQMRKGSPVPYISHPAMVAILLQRYGFEDDVIAAGLLHDVVEDTEITEDELAEEFGPVIGELVRWVSEPKKDAHGQELPWEHRKQDKFENLQHAPVGARAIALADKLHNLQSTLDDQRKGVPIWAQFKATRERWLWNASRVVDQCDGTDPRLHQLAEDCRGVIAALRAEPLPAEPMGPG